MVVKYTPLPGLSLDVQLSCDINGRKNVAKRSGFLFTHRGMYFIIFKILK